MILWPKIHGVEPICVEVLNYEPMENGNFDVTQ